MRVDDLQHIYAGREQYAEVAVAAVAVFEVFEERGRVVAVELVGRAVGVLVGVVLVVDAQRIGLLEALVSAVVPVDSVYRRGQCPDDDRHAPVAFVVYLAGSGTYRREGRGLLDIRYVVGGVVDSRIAYEVDVRGQSYACVYLSPRVVADHVGLQRVELRGAAVSVVYQHLVVLSSERLVLAVLVCEHADRAAYQRVEYRQFPVLLVVYLSETGQRHREPAYLRQAHRVAYERVAALAVGLVADLASFGIDAVARGGGYGVPHQTLGGHRAQRVQLGIRERVGRYGKTYYRVQTHSSHRVACGQGDGVGALQGERVYRDQRSRAYRAHVAAAGLLRR